MKKPVWIAMIVVCVAFWCPLLKAQAPSRSECPRPQAGSVVGEPEDLRSQNGVLEVSLTAYDSIDTSGAKRYCYADDAGRESPNLRVSPGDLVILHLKNKLTDLSLGGTAAVHAHVHPHTTD